MRKIQIDKMLQDEVEIFCTNLFVNTRRSDFTHPKIKLKTLYNDLRPIKHKNFRTYVNELIINYEDILKSEPDEIRTFITKFDKILSYSNLTENIPYKKKTFHEAVVEALRYEDLREKEFPHYLKENHIKACVYCNSQLAIVVNNHFTDKKTKKRIKYRKANFELDHFFPKSKFPFLCTSFYNLYPVCSNCNKAKSSNKVKFELYTKGTDLDVFNFWIDDSSIINYWISRNHRVLKVWFEHINGDLDFKKNHDDTFAIQGIFDTQTDLAEELVHKARAYSNAYQKSLVDTFEDLFPDKALIKRLLIGNYDKPEDIHKRPMAKFTQDIAKQLGLI